MSDAIVITATEALTPIGNKLHEISQSLKTGKSGIRLISRYPMDGFDVRHAGEIDTSFLENQNFPLESSLQQKMFCHCLNNIMNFSHPYSDERIGCFIGTDTFLAGSREYNELLLAYNGFGQVIENEGGKTYRYVDPSILLYHASHDYHIHGPCMYNLGTCAASAQAIGMAYRMLKTGQIDMAIAGGVSSRLDPISISRLGRLDALEHTKEDVEENCRPFDKNRSGFTISEGCILFILEREKEARRRDAQILCEIKGYGAAMDGYSATDPHHEALGMQLSMERAIKDAGLNVEDIDYINAHGTGTAKNDYYETMAIKQVFRDTAYSVDISSTKSMHGHLIAAAGAMEALVSLIAIQDGFVPPTIHYQTFDEQCDLNYTPNQRKDKSITNVLTNSFGLGGQNATLILSRYR